MACMKRVDLVGDLAFVKSVATFFANQAERFCQRWILEDIAFRRCAAFAIQRVGFEKAAGETFVETRTERPIIGDEFGDRKTFLGITNGRREIIA